MTSAAWALTTLCLLLLILLAVYRQMPKCPGCGGTNAQRDELLPWVRRCQNPGCRTIYEVRQ